MGDYDVEEVLFGPLQSVLQQTRSMKTLSRFAIVKVAQVAWKLMF
jgi:hypothetical protein